MLKKELIDDKDWKFKKENETKIKKTDFCNLNLELKLETKVNSKATKISLKFYKAKFLS